MSGSIQRGLHGIHGRRWRHSCWSEQLWRLRWRWVRIVHIQMQLGGARFVSSLVRSRWSIASLQKCRNECLFPYVVNTRRLKKSWYYDLAEAINVPRHILWNTVIKKICCSSLSTSGLMPGGGNDDITGDTRWIVFKAGCVLNRECGSREVYEVTLQLYRSSAAEVSMTQIVHQIISPESFNSE